MTEKRFKAWAETIFYSTGAIGIIDMMAQSFSEGKIKIIQSVLGWLFGSCT